MSHETPAVTERPPRTWYRNAGETLAGYAARLRDALLYSSAYLATLAASAAVRSARRDSGFASSSPRT